MRTIDPLTPPQGLSGATGVGKLGHTLLLAT
jgi:hypothetical protein